MGPFSSIRAPFGGSLLRYRNQSNVEVFEVGRLPCATSTECHEAFECVTTQPMREGPSEPAYRRGLQTTFGGCGQKPWS